MPNSAYSRRATLAPPPQLSANKLVRGQPLQTVLPATTASPSPAPRPGSPIPPAPPAMFEVNSVITGLTGGGPTNLDGLDASTLPTLYVIHFFQTGVGAREYQLQVSSAATGPLVVAASGSSARRWIAQM